MSWSLDADRHQLAEYWALVDQLRVAVADAPFVIRGAAEPLVSQAKKLTSSIASFSAITDDGTRVGFFELMQGGGLCHLALSNVEISPKRRKTQNFYNERRTARDCALVIEKLGKSQVCGFRRIDLDLTAIVAELALKQERLRPDAAGARVLIQGLEGLFAWAEGMWNILQRAWLDHRIRIRNEEYSLISERPKCYSRAPKIGGPHALEEPDWALLYPISENEARPMDFDYDENNVKDHGKWHWFLSPRLASALYLKLYIYAGDMEDPKSLECQRFVSELPDFAKPFSKIPAFLQNMKECALRVAARIARGPSALWQLSNCTGEEIMVRVVTKRLKENDNLQNIIEGSLLPASKCDLDVLKVREMSGRSFDVDLLYEEGADPNSAQRRMRRLFNIHPAEWFHSFGNYHYLDHAIVSDRQRTEVRAKAAEIFAKSPSLPPELVHALIAKLSDAELLKICCCAKSTLGTCAPYTQTEE